MARAPLVVLLSFLHASSLHNFALILIVAAFKSLDYRIELSRIIAAKPEVLKP